MVHSIDGAKLDGLGAQCDGDFDRSVGRDEGVQRPGAVPDAAHEEPVRSGRQVVECVLSTAIRDGAAVQVDECDDPAAEPHDERLSIERRCEHSLADFAGSLERFRFLAGRNRNQGRLKVARFEALHDAIGEMRCHIRVRNDRATRALNFAGDELPDAIEQV